MKIRAFITHKMCECYSDCQDRFCINIEEKTIAVSDGISQSIFSDVWAELLSAQYAKIGHCNDDDRKELCVEWLRRVEQFRDEEKAKGENPWHLNNCLSGHRGAGATLCGIRFEDEKNWCGDVLGDSCIIEIDVRNWTAKIMASEEKPFDVFPDYYDSFPEKKGKGSIKSFNGVLDENYVLLLVSDPFSEYIDKYRSDCREIIEQILRIRSHSEFCSLVDDWRAKGMHNDDSTLCLIEFDGKKDLSIEWKDDIDSLIIKEQKDKQAEEIVIKEEGTESVPMDATNDAEEVIEKTDTICKTDSPLNEREKITHILETLQNEFIKKITSRSKKDKISVNTVKNVTKNFFEKIKKEIESIITYED